MLCKAWMTTYCEEQWFHLSFLPLPTHDVLILCMNRWAAKTWYDSSDETSFQNIPTNWFHDYSVQEQIMEIHWMKKGVCVGIHEKNFLHAHMRMRSEIIFWSIWLSGTMENLHLKDFLCLFRKGVSRKYRYQVLPHTRERVKVWNMKELLKSEMST